MKKKTVIIILIVLFILLIIPVPLKLKDGGTTTYNAVLYRIVVWHALDENEPSGYKTGTEFHIFPFNFN